MKPGVTAGMSEPTTPASGIDPDAIPALAGVAVRGEAVAAGRLLPLVHDCRNRMERESVPDGCVA